MLLGETEDFSKAFSTAQARSLQAVSTAGLDGRALVLGGLPFCQTFPERDWYISREST